jgi:hypothetical protein
LTGYPRIRSKGSRSLPLEENNRSAAKIAMARLPQASSVLTAELATALVSQRFDAAVTE